MEKQFGYSQQNCNFPWDEKRARPQILSAHLVEFYFSKLRRYLIALAFHYFRPRRQGSVGVFDCTYYVGDKKLIQSCISTCFRSIGL